MNNIFILNGSSGCGKDTFAEIAHGFFLTNQYPFTVFNVSSVDVVKRAGKMLGWDGERNEKGRKFLSDLKLLSIQYYDGPFKYISECIEDIDFHSILFLHIREPEEIDKVVQAYPYVKTLLIRRDGLTVPENMSDQNVENYDYDYVIENNSSKEQYVKDVITFIKENIL